MKSNMITKMITMCMCMMVIGFANTNTEKIHPEQLIEQQKLQELYPGKSLIDSGVQMEIQSDMQVFIILDFITTPPWVYVIILILIDKWIYVEHIPFIIKLIFLVHFFKTFTISFWEFR